MSKIDLQTGTSVQSYSDPSRSCQILDALADEWRNGDNCDIMIKVGEQTFKAHKLVLSSFSSYFKSLFQFGGRDRDTVTLTSMTSSVFSDMLQFAYTGSISLSTTNIQELMMAADYLDVPYILEEGQRFMAMRMDTHNACSLLQFAVGYNLKELRRIAKTFVWKDLMIQSGHTDPEKIKALSADVLAEVLSFDEPGQQFRFPSDVEEAVLETVLIYLSEYSDSKPEVFKSLLSTVRFPFIKHSHIISQLKKFPLLKGNEILRSFTRMSSEWSKHTKSSTKSADWKKKFPSIWGHCRCIDNAISYTHTTKCLVPFETKPVLDDPFVEIGSIKVFVSQVGEALCVSGIVVRYRRFGEECDFDLVKGHISPTAWEYSVQVTELEYISEVTVKLHDPVVAGLEFKTNFGKSYGPYGSKVSRDSVTKSSLYKERLYDITCDYTTREGICVLRNMSLKWRKLTT